MTGNGDKSASKLREWQSRMNWASEAERNVFLLACICCILLPPLGISSLSIPLSGLLLLSHLLLLLYCATNVQRKYAIASNLLVMISLANFLLANYSGLRHADVLIYVFCAMAFVSLPFSITGYARSSRKATEHASLVQQEDFRWMLTSAPLMTRWKFHEKLREEQALP
ncbi:hypothetical protein KDL29_00185 [bacterium]|nr:hypothetical protein [bacterium]